MATAEPSSIAAQYDLTSQIAAHLDVHLILPLLEFLSSHNIHNAEEIQRAKLSVLSKTNMIDFAIEVHKSLNKTDSAPADLAARREAVISQLKALTAELQPVLAVLEERDVAQEFKTVKDFDAATTFMTQNNISSETVEKLYTFAKFTFETGNYSSASKLLGAFRALSRDADKIFSALWGKLAADILMQDWDMALEDIEKLRDSIDARKFSSSSLQLQHRTWLLHWSLFVFFNHASGRTGIQELYFDEKYLNALQTQSPHLLRYLTTAVITNKRRRNLMRDLVSVIEQEKFSYKDPITEFVECLYINFDFDAAQIKLRECEELLANDFFLVACRDEFIENARLLIFEIYCRIHHCIDIGMLAEKLNMDRDGAERWIVNLIRSARLDAKIDSKANTVVMGTPAQSMYQDIIEKTKGLSFRSYVLANSVEKQLLARDNRTQAEF